MPTGVYKHKPLTQKHKDKISEGLKNSKKTIGSIKKGEHRGLATEFKKGVISPNHYNSKPHEKGERSGESNPNWKGGSDASNTRSLKREGEYTWKSLNTKFKGSDGHHIDMNRVVFIPTSIHQNFRPHSPFKRKYNMETIKEAKNLDILNSVAYAELFYNIGER